MNRLKITYIHSTIHAPKKHKLIVQALGLRRLNQTIIQPDNAAIRGMVEKVHHLVRVEGVNES